MNNYITYGYRLVDGDMRLDSGQSEAVQLIFDAYDGGESIKKDSKDAKGQEGTYHPWKTVLDTRPYPENLV